MTNFFDFNTASVPDSTIPKGTVVRVRMIIKPGNYNDESKGWTGGFATLGKTGSVYLSCEFIVIGGKYNSRRFYSLIGLHSEKGPTWGEMGRTTMRGIVESSRGVSAKDQSPEANKNRMIASFADLDGIEFVTRVGVDDSGDEPKNVLSTVVTCDQKAYREFVAAEQGGGFAAAATPSAPAPAWGGTAAPAVQAAQAAPAAKPAWAQ